MLSCVQCSPPGSTRRSTTRHDESRHDDQQRDDEPKSGEISSPKYRKLSQSDMSALSTLIRILDTLHMQIHRLVRKSCRFFFSFLFFLWLYKYGFEQVFVFVFESENCVSFWGFVKSQNTAQSRTYKKNLQLWREVVAVFAGRMHFPDFERFLQKLCATDRNSVWANRKQIYFCLWRLLAAVICVRNVSPVSPDIKGRILGLGALRWSRNLAVK